MEEGNQSNVINEEITKLAYTARAKERQKKSRGERQKGHTSRD